MRRVNPRTHTPVPATILILVVAVFPMVGLPGGARLELITASTILPGLLLAGGMYFIGLLIFNREALATEPAAVSVFKH
jgi:amino acid transporter